MRLLILALMLVGLPLLGVTLAGEPLERYFEFPPRSLYIEHAPFSWMAFFLMIILISIFISPFVIQMARWISSHRNKSLATPTIHFPRWGWIGIGFGLASWILAWNRFPWFATFQAHTFTPLWISYIVVINALTYRRSGKCMMLNQTQLFIKLFPMSAGFWWFFEYLNRFVQNWHYFGTEQFNALEYFFFATLSFSTVLPAVLSTREWLATFSIFDFGFRNFRAPFFLKQEKFRYSKIAAGTVLLLSALGLGGIGVWPNELYPLLWISPLLIIVSLQVIRGTPHIFSKAAEGDSRIIVTSAVAALICGFFWEMWNFHSFAKWVYEVPYVERFHIFEMPLLGYAGYLPFGLECIVISHLLGIQNTQNDVEEYHATKRAFA